LGAIPDIGSNEQKEERKRSSFCFGILTCMELVTLTEENIDQYLEDCIAVQRHLVKPEEVIDAERFKLIAKDSHSFLLGIQVDGHIIGLGEVCKVVHPVHIVGYVHNIVIDPAHRGKGIFSFLMNALEAKAKKWGCDQMNLTCSRSEVQPLYEKRGYLKKETNFYTFKLS
jgi:GNAT superfamily N-acetyltransferase